MKCRRQSFLKFFDIKVGDTSNGCLDHVSYRLTLPHYVAYPALPKETCDEEVVASTPEEGAKP